MKAGLICPIRPGLTWMEALTEHMVSNSRWNTNRGRIHMEEVQRRVVWGIYIWSEGIHRVPGTFLPGPNRFRFGQLSCTNISIHGRKGYTRRWVTSEKCIRSECVQRGELHTRGVIHGRG